MIVFHFSKVIYPISIAINYIINNILYYIIYLIYILFLYTLRWDCDLQRISYFLFILNIYISISFLSIYSFIAIICFALLFPPFLLLFCFGCSDLTFLCSQLLLPESNQLNSICILFYHYVVKMALVLY